MKFRELAELMSGIEKISSRNDMVKLLAEFFLKLNIDEVAIVAYLLQGRVAPSFVDVEFNYSEKGILNLLEAYIRAKGTDFDIVKSRENSGDIGDTVSDFVKFMNIKSAGLNIHEVYENLWKIVNVSGTNSVAKKGEYYLGGINKMDELEAKFFTRIVTGNLRLGCSLKTLIDALSVAVAGDKSLSDNLNNTYGFSTDIGFLAQEVIENRADTSKIMEVARPVPGIPFFPRLVQRVGSFEEGFERIGTDGYIQPKYDGVRCQIHKGVDYSDVAYKNRAWSKGVEDAEREKDSGSFDMFGGESQHDGPVKKVKTELFSRNLELFTDMFPEVVESVQNLPCEACVLDCEVVGMRNGKYVPFQDTMTRRRKYDVGSASEEVPVFAMVFDILYLDGEDLTKLPLVERLARLEGLIGNGSGCVMLAESVKNESLEVLHAKFEEYVKENLEGLILKKFDESYIPNVRDFGWVKIKKSINKELVDTVDLVVLGYYRGSGKQVKYGMGALLAGVYNEKTALFDAVTKIGTGITEEQWESISAKLKSLTVEKKPVLIADGKYVAPDAWVSPEVVVTVEADEISRSSNYSAGEDILGFGLALRFPRLVVFGRDKMPEDATSLSELVAMYNMRKGLNI